MGFEIFGIGLPEMVIIMVVALIFLGPERLPEVARTIGGWVRELRGLAAEASGVWQETLQVGETIRDTVLYKPAGTAPIATTLPTAPPLHEAELGYMPPEAIPPQEQVPPPPATLAYPAPFAAPASRPPQAEKLAYPAPFAEQRGEEGG